jgi:hypothetical protein
MHCNACDQAYYYPRRYCPRCWSADTEWREASRRGTVYSYSVVRESPAPPFRDMVPYGLVLVDLAEGPRMMVNWDPAAPLERLACGAPVEITFRTVSDALSLPQCRPAASGAG